jgi:hypothetical protein
LLARQIKQQMLFQPPAHMYASMLAMHSTCPIQLSWTLAQASV